MNDDGADIVCFMAVLQRTPMNQLFANAIVRPINHDMMPVRLEVMLSIYLTGYEC